jgi:hypothetical protein
VISVSTFEAFNKVVIATNYRHVDPLAYLTDVLTRIVNGYPNGDIDQLLPWAYRKQDLRPVA